MTRLSTATLPGLPATVALPRYDRATVTPGIVHLGLGAFHRAHQAVFIDDCLGRGETGWGIIAVSLRSPDARDALAPQDGLYTYCERDGTTDRLRIIGSVIETLVAPEDPARLIDRLADPRIRIVTLTVTEKGYLANLTTRTLLHDHPDIRHDLANPDAPRSIYGFLLAATIRRRAAGAVPLTLLSCDNLPSNGTVLGKMLADFAALRDPALADWIRTNVAYPCVMVDRIVPATAPADRDRIAATLGVDDAAAVVAEPYFRWVIEDLFPHGCPSLELSGAEFVPDVEPYEHMKLRMLNGAHTAIAAIGQITGLATVADAYGDVRVRRFIDRYWAEVGPTLGPDMDAAAYVDGLRKRFANPALQHRCVQIASDASQKVPQRILSPLRDLITAGAPHPATLMALALWIRSCGARNEAGLPITINDPAFNDWTAPDQDTTTPDRIIHRFLGFDRVFGPEWQADAAFVTALTAAFCNITDNGAFAALDSLLGE